MEKIDAPLDASGRRFGLVVARWNELVTAALREGALEELRRHGDPETVVVEVPGSWEIPPTVKALVETRPLDAVIALGCILQGETPHAARLAAEVGAALMRLQIETGVPIAWGILTPDTVEQALDRSGLKMGNKGREAALVAVEMAAKLRVLRSV